MTKPEEPGKRSGLQSRAPGLLRVIGALAAGFGMALTLPPFGFGGAVWVVMLPLLAAVWSVRGKRAAWKGFGLGWLAGATAFLTGMHWLTEVTGVGWVVVGAYLALYPAVWGAFAATWANPWRMPPETVEDSGVARKIREKSEKAAGPESHWRQSLRSLRVAFALAAFWCGLEWLRGWVFTGFGWNTLGVAFHDTPVMAQAADLLGICGLSFIPVFLQAVIVQTARRLRDEARSGRLRPHVDFGVAVLLVALCFCYGVWRLRTAGGEDPIRFKVLLVQLNIPQDAARRLWTPEQIHFGYEEETLGALEEIEEEDAERIEEGMEAGAMTLDTPDWIMWPESALTGKILRLKGGEWATWGQNLETISRVRERGEFTLAMGLQEAEGKRLGEELVRKADGDVWNSLVVFDPEAELTTYRKHHLVIFGEYIPLADKIPFLRWIYRQQSGAEYGGAYAKGERFEPLPAEAGGEEVGMIPSVCFEDTVPRLMRRFVEPGPQWIANVTNDGWFRNSPAAAQHFANAKFRAIELRRPMVRCANNGVSAAVNPLGTTAHPDTGEPQELRDESGSHLTRGWLLADVDIPREPAGSLYILIGDAGVIGLGVLGLLVGWTGRRRR